MKIIVPDERPMSWNQLYSGKHWAVRSEEAIRVHSMVVAHLPLGYTMFKERVDVFITVYFRNRPFDPDNIASKFYVDGLKGKVISDDTPKEIGFVAVKSEVDKESPRLELELRLSQT